MKNLYKNFTSNLMLWHCEENNRSLPWKNETDPYKIWLSEIILQQTRAEQGLNYYLNFIRNYPTICDLAKANTDEVFLLWQGLGYYNRCKNMLATARYICEELNGKFPNEYEKILSLKGVGTYTAAAIASFAYNQAYAVVDGNVYRVLARYFGIDEAIDGTKGKAFFTQLATNLLDKKLPALYNQAIMDLGATICTPKNAQCELCPLRKKCVATQKPALLLLLPIKEKKLKVRNRFFNFLVLRHENNVWIERRSEKGIWQNLHQFYLIETDESINNIALEEHEAYKCLSIKKTKLLLQKTIKQRLTHQLIESKIYILNLKRKNNSLPKNGFWIPTKNLKNYAFPKTLVSFLEENFDI